MKSLVTILFSVLIVIISCCGTIENPCSLSEEVWSEFKKADSILKDTARIRIYAEWMKNNYDEPNLYNTDYETYRFVKNCVGWYTSTKIVRIENLETHYKAIIKEFVDTIESGELRELTLTKNYEFELSEKDWQIIKSKLEESNFWITNTFDKKGYMHGCSWSLEGYKLVKDKCTKQNYHGISGRLPVDSLYLAIYKVFDNLGQKKRLQHKNKLH